MLDYLHKRSKEHLKEKNSLIETISELENELMKKEKNCPIITVILEMNIKKHWPQ